MIKGIPEPAEDSPTWPHVLRFAKIMEYKLSLNRHKGDRRGWLDSEVFSLLDRVDDEIEELNEAIGNLEPAAKVIVEAADVANFAMMIADHFSDDL
jgi:NTP pyrophosphatase (non-canonical NTP hydrolase)